MESQYFRTFIGLPLHVGESFLGARSDLMSALKTERISWTQPELYHVTLRFLGDTELKVIEKIKQGLHQGMSVPQRVSLEFAGLSSFGPRKRPRVIWAGFEENVFFELLKKELDHQLEMCGIPGTEQSFRAHLTLGRVRSLQNTESYYQTLDGMSMRFSDPVSFEHLVFYRSIPGPDGPEYIKLDSIKLR